MQSSGCQASRRHNDKKMFCFSLQLWSGFKCDFTKVSQDIYITSYLVFSNFRSLSIDSLRAEGAGRDERVQSRAADGGDWDSGQNESSAKQLMIRGAYQTLWLIYVLHGSSCLLMQLFTYLEHGGYLSFPHCDWIWKQIKQATEFSTD